MTGSVERRGPKRWRARYWAPDGRQRSKTFERRIDADRWLAQASVALTRGEWTDPARARVAVGDWSRQWFTTKSATLKATTAEDYRSLLATCILPTWERVPLSAVTHGDLAAWLAVLSAQVGSSRCRKAVTLMSGIMAAAVRDQRIARNPCVGLTLPRLPEPRQRFLTLEELQRLASEAGDYRVMVLVLGLCGLRIGECLALRIRSVDALRRRLRVSESVSEVGGKLIWSTPKNHQSRDVPMPRTVAELVVGKTTGKGSDDLLFTSPEGEPIRLPNWRRRVWGGATARAGLSGLTPHDLRHTAASLAIASGASVKGVQRMLGHQDAAMTLNVYASLFEDDLDAVSERLDAAIAKAAVSSLCPETSNDVVSMRRITSGTGLD